MAKVTGEGAMSKAIAIVATLDTKGEEASYVKELIAQKGAQSHRH